MKPIPAIFYNNQTLTPCYVRKNFFTGVWEQHDGQRWIAIKGVSKNAHVVFHDGAWRVVV